MLNIYQILAKEHQLIAEQHMKCQFHKYCFGNIYNMSPQYYRITKN